MQTERKGGPIVEQKKDAALPPAVRRVVQATRAGKRDPLGSYTGTPADRSAERPTQDADDL